MYIYIYICERAILFGWWTWTTKHWVLACFDQVLLSTGAHSSSIACEVGECLRGWLKDWPSFATAWGAWCRLSWAQLRKRRTTNPIGWAEKTWSRERRLGRLEKGANRSQLLEFRASFLSVVLKVDGEIWVFGELDGGDVWRLRFFFRVWAHQIYLRLACGMQSTGWSVGIILWERGALYDRKCFQRFASVVQTLAKWSSQCFQIKTL